MLALFVVHHETGNVLLSSLAFGIGFVALTLANSELFTENFLVPIAAVLARKSSVRRVLRLWTGTLVMNLLSGWLMMVLVVTAFPRLEETAIEVGSHFPGTGIGWRSFAASLLGGAVITLMTWMERSTPSVPAKLAAAVSVAFLLAAAPLNHVVVVSLEMFAGLEAGAPYSYLDWLTLAAWYALGNLVGGVVLVTSLRLVQVGAGKVTEERDRPGAGAGASRRSPDTGTTE